MINSFTLSKSPPSPWVRAEQVHGSAIVRVDVDQAGQTIAGVDGLITRAPNLFLTVRTADCLPLSLYDPKRQIIGLVHAGWQGVRQRIHLKALKLFNSPPQDILVGLGPSICADCYHRHFDLAGTVKHDLISLGIPAANINQSAICTCEDNRFPSHQRHRTKDRIINFISLKP